VILKILKEPSGSFLLTVIIKSSIITQYNIYREHKMLLSQKIDEIYKNGYTPYQETAWSKFKRNFVRDIAYDKYMEKQKASCNNSSALLRLKSHFEEHEKNPDFSSIGLEYTLKDFSEIIQAGSVVRFALLIVQLKQEGLVDTETRLLKENGEIERYKTTLDMPSNADWDKATAYVKIL